MAVREASRKSVALLMGLQKSDEAEGVLRESRRRINCRRAHKSNPNLMEVAIDATEAQPIGVIRIPSAKMDCEL
jgi:hypothetical protein